MPAASAGGGAFGLFLTDGTKVYGFYQKQNGGIYIEYWSAGGTFGSNIATDSRYSTPYVFPYMRIRRNSSTSYDYQVSGDGREWFAVLSANDPTANMTPTDIGVGGFVGSALGASDVVIAACDWLRQTA